MKLRDSDGYYTNRHSCFLLQYHLVLVTKYRNPVLRGRVADGMREYIKRYFSDRGLPVHAFDIQQDPSSARKYRSSLIRTLRKE